MSDEKIFLILKIISMIKNLILCALILITECSLSYCTESIYSEGLSRLEREWLHKEHRADDDEVRIGRLEEKVFGTIHEKDIKSRYIQLRDAFDAQKRMRNRANHSFFGGVPTSIPSDVFSFGE